MSFKDKHMPYKDLKSIVIFQAPTVVMQKILKE